MKAEVTENRTISAKKEDNFSEWYVQVIINSEFADYSAVSGCIVFRPSSYFAWEQVRDYVDGRFKDDGIENVYFPTLIPERLLQKEGEHIIGFSPEVAWVTQTGDTKLDERLAVRPTSEAIMYDNLSKWIRSWRDLPMRLNQWNSVVRWEFKHPTPFLRTREFLWNEGHSAFASEEEAEAEGKVILGIYHDVLKDYLALYGIPGEKTQKEKFAGAIASFSIEHLMPDGKAVQGPAFHLDGNNFSKAFDIKFIDNNGEKRFVFQNTWAISTREFGVMIATHSDNKGLVLPPKLAKIQIVIVPIYNDKNRDEIIGYSTEIYNMIKGEFRVYHDIRDEYSPGWKFNEWELKGVPIRVEVGKREMGERNMVAKMRHTSGSESISLDNPIEVLKLMLEKIHNDLYESSKRFVIDNTHVVENYTDLKEVIKRGGFAQSPWCGSQDCEDRIKDETIAKATNMPFHIQELAKGKRCVLCGKPAKHIVNFSRSH